MLDRKGFLFLRLAATLAAFVIPCAPSIAAAQTASPLLCADGGSLKFDFNPQSPFRNLHFTLKGERLVNGMQVRGSVAHPYGEGPFEVAFSEYVQLATAQTFADRIDFSFSIRYSIGDGLQTLFTAKPVPESTYVFGRPNGSIYGEIFVNYANYPFALRWLTCNVETRNNEPVQTIVKTNPVLIYEDVEFGLAVRTEGFDPPVRNITLSALRGVDLYPPINAATLAMYGTTMYGIASYPKTFDVTLTDGSVFRITPPQDGAYPIILRPPSYAFGWEEY